MKLNIIILYYNLKILENNSWFFYLKFSLLLNQRDYIL